MQRQPDDSGWGFWTNDVAANGRDHTRLAFETDGTEFFPKLASLCAGSSASAPIPLDGLANLTYDAATNHITTAGFAYDAAGNQTRTVRTDGSAQRFQRHGGNANYTYGCKDCVTVDKAGFLAVNIAGLSQDVLKATAYLTDAITSNDPNKLFSVQVTNNNSEVAFGDSVRGGAGVRVPGNQSAIRIRLDFGDDKAVIGDKAAKEAFLNMVFAHEVAHFVPNYVNDPTNGRDTGPVVDAVNEIQQARGLLLRAQYGAFGRGRTGDFVSVEFGKVKTDRAGNIARNKAGGIEVNRTNKTVTWIKRTVGGIGIN